MRPILGVAAHGPSGPKCRETVKTFTAKPAETLPTRKWWVVDAKGQSLGRVASRIAHVLRGKHKPIFTPHTDTGDFVIVINAKMVRVTGKKTEDKMYYAYSGHPGGLKGRSYRELLEKHPDAPLRAAVRGMLPKNTLGRKMLAKLKIYPTAEHPHAAQQPQPMP